ncbi:MAG: hypothetical protein PVI04_03030 [Anaerolineales bacterium]
MKAQSFINRAKQFWADRALKAQIRKVEHFLQSRPPRQDVAPVLFFNASTRIHRLSLNAAYSLLSSWALRAEGVPVRYLVCHAGMEQCVLGAAISDPPKPPPCRTCMRFSTLLFPDELTVPIESDNAVIASAYRELEGMSLGMMMDWKLKDIPLGRLCLPGLQWSLRRGELKDDEATRRLFRQFLASAASLTTEFSRALDEVQPGTVVVFNGVFYPEAILRELAMRRNISVVTHEVGLRPASAYFTHDHATFRKVEVPEGYELSPLQEQRLDRYLEERFEGRFSMAGVRFWPEMEGLPEELAATIERFDQAVVVFTNVIFDTSQVHANTYFEDMFAWLEYLEGVFAHHPETLFILRAHPDEDRPGKTSRQSVSKWVREHRLAERENVVFLAPSDYVSSYDLVRSCKFVLVYNSSIGIEATILGTPVLMAGRARYSHEETAFIPADRHAYERRLESFLEVEEIEVPPSMVEAARRLLYLELFHASLDLSSFLEPEGVLPGMVVFSDFEVTRLKSDEVLNVIREGILADRRFNIAFNQGLE